MTIEEIKKAVDQGKNVFWCNHAYKVIKDKLNEYLIIYSLNNDAIGLTSKDGKNLNGKEIEFFIN